MYKCTDCDKLYEIKPEYCECGNNIFEEIVPAPRSAVSVNQAALQEKSLSPAKTRKKSFYEQYPGIKRFVDSLDVVSATFFVICIILSVLALVFINPAPDTSGKEEHKTVKQSTKNIPDIEKLWNDTAPAPVSKPAVNVVQQAPDVPETVTTAKPKTSVRSQPNTKPAVNTKAKSASYKSSSAASSGSVKPSQTVKKAQTVAKTQSAAKKQTTTKTQTAAQTQATTKTQNVTKTQTASKTQTPQNDEEWYNYRIALRQALFHNLSVTSINGSGKCQIEFAIDKNGKFINRAFSYQSPNESVNQAVYKMMMKLPSYYPPPDSYKGQKVKMVFSFDNGSYYINYVN